MPLKRLPGPALRPFVEFVWVTDGTGGSPESRPFREHVLPTGAMHLVFRLRDRPLRLFSDSSDVDGHLVGDALLGGARASFYIREVSAPLCSVGAQLRPGAAEALFGVPADELAGRHTGLQDLWGNRSVSIRDELSERGRPDERLALFEAVLAARLPQARALHPAVAQALEQFNLGERVREVVAGSEYSHRTFVSLFRHSVGLPPKRYCRVLRFRRALRLLAQAPAVAWADLALGAGYSDQAHFSREFREFTGVAPTDYRRAAPRVPDHLPLETIG